MISLDAISPKFTEAVLQDICDKVQPGSKLSSYDVKTCGTRGTSYQSELYRITIHSTTHSTINAFVKALPRNYARRMTFRSPEFYAKEVEFLDKIWPAFVDLQREHNIADPYTDIPQCLATFVDGENDFIVMEDLSQSGFRSADRQLDVDLAHCKLALGSFGKLHGLSHAMRVLQPEKFKLLTSHMKDIYYAETTRSWNEDMVALEVDVALNAVRKEYPGTETELSVREFMENVPKFYSEMAKLTSTCNEYAVIGHGDCWPPNFMFSYEGKRPSSMKIIDFQLVRLGSCALDVSFFVYSCTSDDLRRDHYEDMLQWYFDGVRGVLEQFQLNVEKVFPWSVFKKELKEFARFGVGTAIEAIPVSIMDEEDTTDMDAIEGAVPLKLNEIWKLKPMKDEIGRRRLADVFKHAVEQGYL